MHKRRARDSAEANNKKARYYLEAIGEGCPGRLPVLPTALSVSEKCQNVALREPSNLCVEYRGTSSAEADAVQVRTNFFIPVECGIYYFECRILNKGKDGFLGVGFTSKEFRSNRLPGWDRGSYGYHGDAGKKYRGCGSGEPYGPPFTMGDVVGCMVNFLSCSIAFTKNGALIGPAFTDLKDMELFPVVGMRSEGECIEVNLGSEPFAFDFRSYVQEERDRVHTLIRGAAVKEMDSTCCSCVLSYLVQQGYPESAAVFAKSCGREEEVKLFLEPTRQRRAILDAVLQGSIPTAVELLNQWNPRFLELRRDVMLMLRCQQFAEMVKSGRDLAEVLEFGAEELQAVFDPDAEDEGVEDVRGEVAASTADALSSSPVTTSGVSSVEASRQEKRFPAYRVREILQKVFSLVGYGDPHAACPHSYLLDQQMRAVVAAKLNTALLDFLGSSTRPALERIAQQARVIVDQLESHSIVGLLMKDTLPLGYAEQGQGGGSSSNSGGGGNRAGDPEWSIAHFYDGGPES
eukprot:RCo037761